MVGVRVVQEEVESMRLVTVRVMLVGVVGGVVVVGRWLWASGWEWRQGWWRQEW